MLKQKEQPTMKPTARKQPEIATTSVQPKENMVNHPSHYQFTSPVDPSKKLESVEVMEIVFYDNIHLANAFKYMSRAGKKQGTSYVEDIEKAVWWLNRSLQKSQ